MGMERGRPDSCWWDIVGGARCLHLIASSPVTSVWCHHQWITFSLKLVLRRYSSGKLPARFSSVSFEHQLAPRSKKVKGHLSQLIKKISPALQFPWSVDLWVAWWVVIEDGGTRSWVLRRKWPSRKRIKRMSSLFALARCFNTPVTLTFLKEFFKSISQKACNLSK